MFNNWEELEREASTCKKCRLCETRKNVVFGTGNKDAEIMLIGEGPGADEDAQGPCPRRGDMNHWTDPRRQVDRLGQVRKLLEGVAQQDEGHDLELLAE